MKNGKLLKLLVFVFVSGVFFPSLEAQEKEKEALLEGSPSFNTENLGFFISPGYGFSQLDGAAMSLFHLRAGVIIKDIISIGGYMNTSLNQIEPESIEALNSEMENGQSVYMDFWTAGGFVEFTLMADKLVHLTFPIHIGYGELQLDNDAGDAGLGEVNFFHCEPAALLEVNLHKNVRFNIGGSYRLVGNLGYQGLDQNDVNGFNAQVGLKFGLFK